MSRSRRLQAAALAAVATIGLSACSAHPGDAAVVGSQSISDKHVDKVATSLCSAQSRTQQNVRAQALSSRAARQGALNVLINSSLSRQFGDDEGVDPDRNQLSQALTSEAQTIAAVPAGQRVVFKKTLTEYVEGQLILAAAGQAALQASGTANPQPQQSLDAGLKLRQAWADKHGKVSVNPRYGRFSKGALVGSSGSVSVPVSAGAVAGAKEQPASTWVQTLPANQKCS